MKKDLTVPELMRKIQLEILISGKSNLNWDMAKKAAKRIADSDFYKDATEPMIMECLEYIYRIRSEKMKIREKIFDSFMDGMTMRKLGRAYDYTTQHISSLIRAEYNFEKITGELKEKYSDEKISDFEIGSNASGIGFTYDRSKK